MINKKKLNFAKLETFLAKKRSANSANTAYTQGTDGRLMIGTPDIMWQTVCFIKDEQKIWTGGQMYSCDENPTKVSELDNDSEFITLTDVKDDGYQKTEDADKKYMPKTGGSGNQVSTLSISSKGSFNNYGDNGQAFNAVRDLTGTTKYLGDTGSGYVLNAASFGVKDNGTTAFSHKKYDSFNKDTGAYTNAKNTAVLVFSGQSGLLYAKNTGTAADVTDAMYRRVGVIDSPDEEQRVYSATQIDTLITKIKTVLTELGATEEQINSIKL